MVKEFLDAPGKASNYNLSDMIEIGQAWERSNPEEHLFFCHPVISRSRINKTALMHDNLPETEALPKKIMLPIKESEKLWTAITLDIQKQDDCIAITLSYVHSVGNKREIFKSKYNSYVL